MNVGESQITQSLKVRDLGVTLTNFSPLMIILLLYVEAHIFVLETLEKLGIYYRIMLVPLLFMHLLVVDWIIVIPYGITFLRIKLIACKDFRINMHVY